MLASGVSLALIGLLTAFQDSLIYIARDYKSYQLGSYYASALKQFEAKHGAVKQLSFNSSLSGQPSAAYLVEPKRNNVSPERLFVLLGGNAELGLDSLWYLFYLSPPK